ncbi:Quinolinate synthase A [Dissostichus eleginoides]|uniref:Quinolinate synthase A n=1 Tax=Dissostichus eleginoides TaxID=100907 RepID=A0AAD9FFH2_DISEL|nr:Quinolinate synthase A [Dissostichus eleginoides]
MCPAVHSSTTRGKCWLCIVTETLHKERMGSTAQMNGRFPLKQSSVEPSAGVYSPHQSLLLPLMEASTSSYTLQMSEGLCLLKGLHYHTRGLPDRHTVPPPKMGRVNRTGVNPCGRSILMELRPRPRGSPIPGSATC